MVLVIAIAIFAIVGINKNYGSTSAFIASVFGGSPTTKPATIEKTTSSDGNPAYLLTIYAKKNYKVRFRAGSDVEQIIDIQDGFAAFRVSEEIWVPTEAVDSATVEVTPDVTLIAPDGTETKVEFKDKIVIDIPSLTLNLTTPPTDTYTASTQEITIAGSVDDSSVQVFAGETQLQVDSSGNFTGNYTLSGDASQTVTIEAKKSGLPNCKEDYKHYIYGQRDRHNHYGG